MLTDLKDNITLFIKNIKKSEKEMPKTSMKYQEVSARSCKRMLSRLQEVGSCIASSELIEVYIDGKNKYFFYIEDYELSKVLYESLTNNVDIFETIPVELENIKFVCSKKQKRVFFITFENIERHRECLNREYIQYVLSNFYPSVLWICNNLSTSNTKIYIDLNVFFRRLIYGDNSFLISLFLSITLEQDELDYEKLTDIANTLLDFCSDYYAENFEQLIGHIKSDDGLFSALRKGYYDEQLDSYGYNNLPVYLYVNIFKLAMNKNCFQNLNEFFDNTKIEEFEKNLEKEEFVFDENKLRASSKKISENENFVCYSVKRTQGTVQFYQIKNHDEIQNLKDLLQMLFEKELIAEYKVLYSLESDNCYIMSCWAKNIPLSKYINSIGNNEGQMLKLLSLINTTFISSAEIRKNLFINKNIGLLDHIRISVDDQQNSSLGFNSIFNISCKKSDTCVEFRYSLAIMEAIKQYLQNNKISIDDIYKCEFMKLFTPSFASEIINYLKTQSYTSRGMIKKLKDTLDEKYANKIEFLENISLNETETVSKITFFNSVETNQTMKDILDCQQAIDMSKDKKLNASYISLAEIVGTDISKETYYLSESIMNKLFYNFALNNTSALLMPEKLIISKDFVNEDSYQILGIIWTHSKLYSFQQLIKDKVITTPEIYKVIAGQLYLQQVFGYSVSNIVDNTLVDNNLNVVFNCSYFNNSSEIFTKKRLKLKNYYTSIIDALMVNYTAYLDDFEIFSFDEIFYDDYVENPNLLYQRVQEIEFCQEHKKWYLRDSMCTKCQKLYVIDRYETKNLIYNDMAGYFYGSYDKATLYVPRLTDFCYWSNVKLGLENGLYESFAGLRPEKIAFNDGWDYRNRKKCAISYGKYDFSNVIHLESFNMLQRLKAVLVLYKKLVPSILSGNFIVSDERIFTTMFMDKNFKGEIIIPSITLLRCDYILSSDEDLKKHKIEETKKLFADFLQKYISDDKNLKSELDEGNDLLKQLMDDISNHDFNETCIREYLNTKDSYCKVHGFYYSSQDVICPECENDGITKDMVTLHNKKYFADLEKRTPSFEGGEANLYPYGNNQVQKIFKDDVNLEFKSKIIGKALQKAKLIEQFNKEHDDVKIVNVNNVLYSYENNILQLKGYTEECIDGSFKISSLKDKEFVAKMRYERKDVVEILIKVCTGIEFLHSINGFIGDLNGGNILIKDKVVYIIDVDGMSMDDVKNSVYTNLYIYPPSAENKNITADDDWYSFAVQAFYYLTYSHPFRGVCNNRRIPTNEMERMKYGYSILGNHGIKTPNISIGWDFMPNYMVDFFLKTFEGNKRENMSLVLRSFLEFNIKNELKFKKIERNRKVRASINEHSYIDVDYNLIYKEDVKIAVNSGSNLITRDGINFIIPSKNCTYSFNSETGDIFRFDKVYDYSNSIQAENNKIYYTAQDNKTLFVDKLDLSSNTISTYMIKKVTNNEILTFISSGEDKFVLLELNELNNEVDIYCNTTKVASSDKDQNFNEKGVSILYDKISRKWLVLYNGIESSGIVIDSEGNCSNIEISGTMSTFKCFYGNVLYYLEDGKICFYNVNKGTLKKKSCKYANLNSIIQRDGNKFVINNPDASYMYFKS